jgi:hypothetical protein
MIEQLGSNLKAYLLGLPPISEVERIAEAWGGSCSFKNQEESILRVSFPYSGAYAGFKGDIEGTFDNADVEMHLAANRRVVFYVKTRETRLNAKHNENIKNLWEAEFNSKAKVAA